MSDIVESTVSPSQIGRAQNEGASKLLRQGDKFLDLVKIAKRQKALIYCILGYILALVALVGMGFANSPILAIFGYLIYFAIGITSLVCFVRLALAVGHHVVVIVIACLASIIPLVGLLVLLSVNGRASMFLKMGGAKVGLLGVSERELVKLYAGACSNCGYSLRDLQGNLCPECGKPVTM